MLCSGLISEIGHMPVESCVAKINGERAAGRGVSDVLGDVLTAWCNMRDRSNGDKRSGPCLEVIWMGETYAALGYSSGLCSRSRDGNYHRSRATDGSTVLTAMYAEESGALHR
jgi:hypothetical protein